MADICNGIENHQKVAVITDGGMTKLMIYHGDHGWTYEG